MYMLFTKIKCTTLSLQNVVITFWSQTKLHTSNVIRGIHFTTLKKDLKFFFGEIIHSLIMTSCIVVYIHKNERDQRRTSTVCRPQTKTTKQTHLIFFLVYTINYKITSIHFIYGQICPSLGLLTMNRYVLPMVYSDKS